MGSRKQADVLQQGKLRMRAEVTRLIRLMQANVNQVKSEYSTDNRQLITISKK